MIKKRSLGMNRWLSFVAFLTASASLVFHVSHAAAYTYSSPVSRGCHEEVTEAALRAVREELGNAVAGPLPSSGVDEVLLDDLPLRIPKDMRDIGAAALLLGVRDNDLKGRQGLDSTELSTVHGDVDGQREHCLRRPDQDEAALDGSDPADFVPGSKLAIDECRKFIFDKVVRAVEQGLDADGRPDPDRRVTLAVGLPFSGEVNVQLPIFYLYMGQALHTLQDSYTHTLRTADARRINMVLNWVEFAENELHERRDGPPHMVAIDRCDDPDARRRQLRLAAVESSTELLTASLRPGVDNETRIAEVQAVLDRHLGYEPGCTLDNNWCEAPENAYRDPNACNCSVPGATHGRSSGGTLLGCLLPLLGLVVRRRRALGSGAASSLGALLAGLTLLMTAAAHAEEPVPTPPALAPLACELGRQLSCGCANGGTGMQRCLPSGGFGECTPCVVASPPPPSAEVTPAAAATSDAPSQEPIDSLSEAASRLALHTALGASLDNTAMAFAIAGRYRLSDAWSAGLDGEFNPWFSIDTSRFALGTINVYATLIRHYAISHVVALRSTLHLGTSVLLFDLIGAPSGSVGCIWAPASWRWTSS